MKPPSCGSSSLSITHVQYIRGDVTLLSMDSVSAKDRESRAAEKYVLVVINKEMCFLSRQTAPRLLLLLPLSRLTY